MNILLVVGSIGGGGAERVAANLASEFVDLGHEVGIFYWDEKGHETYEINSRIRLHKSPNRLLPLRILGLKSLLRKLSVDIVIGFTDMSNITAWTALSWIPDRPAFVVSIHSDLRIRDATMGLRIKSRFLRVLHKQACQHADRVVVVSDGAKESLIDYYNLETDSVKKIYNPVLKTVNVFSRRPIANSGLKIVTAGRLTQAKNYPLMIRAVKILRDRLKINCRLDIYGSGELRIQLQLLIDELDLSSKISLQGFAANLPAKLAENDIFLLSSSWEGFGNVLVEALDAGLRVVSTDCPSGPREILANGKYGVLVPLDDPDAMAIAIAEELNNPLVVDELELRQHLHKFTKAKIAGEYLKVAHKLVN